jgi:hypothetical protein
MKTKSNAIEVIFKIVALVITSYILNSCFHTSNPDISLSIPPGRSSDIQTATIQPSPKLAHLSVDDWVREQLAELRESKRKYVNPMERQALIRRLLKQDLKFRMISTTCFPTVADKMYEPFDIFPLPYPVEPGTYLIALQCTSAGRSANSYRLFIYTDKLGINPKPLQLTVASRKEIRVIDQEVPIFQYTNELMLEDTIELSSRGLAYDPIENELSLRTGCNQADGRINSLTKYRYEQGGFVLKEFWQSNVKTIQCNGELTLKKFYP